MTRLSKTEAIREWLEKQGYPTEMRVGAMLAKCGFSVEHAVLYDDPVEGKVREIDVVARTGGPEHSAAETILVIECKSQVESWIALTSDPAPIARSNLNPFRSELLDPVLEEEVTAGDFFAQLGKSEVLDPDVIAHAVVSYKSRSVGRPRQDDRNEAQFGAVSAFNAALALEAKQLHSHAERSEPAPIPIFVPLVVIDGELLEYRLQSGGNFLLDPIPWIPTRLNHGVWAGGEFHELLVTVVGYRDLPAYVATIRADIEHIAEALEPWVATLWQAHKRRAQEPAKSRRQPFPRLHR